MQRPRSRQFSRPRTPGLFVSGALNSRTEATPAGGPPRVPADELRWPPCRRRGHCDDIAAYGVAELFSGGAAAALAWAGPVDDDAVGSRPGTRERGCDFAAPPGRAAGVATGLADKSATRPFFITGGLSSSRMGEVVPVYEAENEAAADAAIPEGAICPRPSSPGRRCPVVHWSPDIGLGGTAKERILTPMGKKLHHPLLVELMDRLPPSFGNVRSSRPMQGTMPQAQARPSKNGGSRPPSKLGPSALHIPSAKYVPRVCWPSASLAKNRRSAARRAVVEFESF